ncbi:MAG TPA: hypothetical protein VMU96_02935 [Casimicrobiaceae bacterium]|nr:hypothetical protein [Casimicrobiaceae bacterium]
MPIIMRNAPRRGAAVLAANVTELLRAKQAPHGMKAEARPEELQHSEPHPVYVATLDDLAAGKLLAAAKQTGWRYLLVHNDEVVAEAELSAGRRAAKDAKGAKAAKSAKNEDLAFAGLTHGPFVAATVDGLHAAERLRQVEKSDYELRLLKVPSVYLVALWLHGDDDDLLVPLGQPPAGLKKNKAYTEGAVIRALRTTVARTREFHAAYEANQRKRRPKKR